MPLRTPVRPQGGRWCIGLLCLFMSLFAGSCAVQPRFTPSTLLHTWQTDGMVRSIRFHPAGQLLASVETTARYPTPEYYVVRLRRIPTGEIVRTLGGQTAAIYSLAFSHNGDFIAIGDSAAKVKVWRIADGAALATFTGHTAAVQQVLFAPDDSTIFSVSEDYTIRSWSIASGMQQSSTEWSAFYNCGIAQVGFADNAPRFVIREGTNVLVQSLPDARFIRSMYGSEGSDCLNAERLDLRLSDNARLLAVLEREQGRKESIRIWDLAHGSSLAVLSGHTDSIAAITFSPDNQIIASASGAPYNFLYNDGDRSVRVWRVTDGRAMAVFDPAHDSTIYGLAFSPDSSVLASGSLDGRICFWQVQLPPVQR